MRLRAWWLPALPGEAIHFPVNSVEEGHKLLNALVDYTRYLEGRQLLFGNSAEVGGLQVWTPDVSLPGGGEWVDAEMEIGDEAEWEYVPVYAVYST